MCVCVCVLQLLKFAADRQQTYSLYFLLVGDGGNKFSILYYTACVVDK